MEWTAVSSGSKWPQGGARSLAADVEYASDGWVDRCNGRRLHGSRGMLAPIGLERLHYQAVSAEPDPAQLLQRTRAGSSPWSGRTCGGAADTTGELTWRSPQQPPTAGFDVAPATRVTTCRRPMERGFVRGRSCA